MHSLAVRIVDRWLRRYARPDAAALAAVAHLAPATVVTGGSEGIGLELALVMAEAGHEVVIVARRTDALAAAAERIAARKGAKVHALALDIATLEAPSRLERALAERGLYCDVLVNNAGVGLGGAFTEHSEDRILELLDCNVRALSLLMRRFLPAMLQRGRGGVLNVASLGGLVPGPYQAAYYASKAYVIALTRAARWESRGMGVRITVLAPGPVETAFHARMGSGSSLYRWLLPSISAERVARIGYRGFCWGKHIVFPGATAGLIAIAVSLAPPTLAVPIVGWLLRPRGEAGDA